MRKKIELAKLIPLAWKILWKQRLEQRAKGHDFRGNTYHVTARDMEDQVREFARQILDGKEPGSTEGYYLGTSDVRISGDLNGAVRDWLLRNPKIVRHNFGKGHISGMRFRPVGQPLSPAEQKTIVAKEEDRRNPRTPPRHYSEHYGSPLCTRKRRNPFSCSRSHARTTPKRDEVTCKACLNLLEKEPIAEAAANN